MVNQLNLYLQTMVQEVGLLSMMTQQFHMGQNCWTLGGTESTSGNFKIHTFTGDGTFTVTKVGNAETIGSNVYLTWSSN